MKTPQVVLKNLGLSEAEIKVFLSLHQGGSLTASELTRLTKTKRPTVYYALRQLEDRGLIHKVGSLGVERFQAEAPDKLLTLLTLQRQALDALEVDVQELVPTLTVSTKAPEGKPTVLFYEGEAAVKQAIMDTLYCRDRHIDSLAPDDNFFWQVSRAFSNAYIDKRVARRITTRNLWEKTLEPTIMVRQYAGLSQVRILPADMHGKFRTTVFLYDDAVMYISSLASGYALVVRSKEHHELMKSMYEALWQVSKEVKIN